MPGDDIRLSFSAEKGAEWDAVEAALGDEELTLGDSIRARVDSVVAEWQAQAEAAIETLPIKGVGRQSGLREAIARNTNKSSDGDGSAWSITVEADNPSTNPNEARLPQGFDNDTGFRHPVFANPNMPRSRWTWVQQVPLRHEWFTGTLNDSKRNNVSNEMTDAINDGLQRIDDAGGA